MRLPALLLLAAATSAIAYDSNALPVKARAADAGRTKATRAGLGVVPAVKRSRIDLMGSPLGASLLLCTGPRIHTQAAVPDLREYPVDMDAEMLQELEDGEGDIGALAQSTYMFRKLRTNTGLASSEDSHHSVQAAMRRRGASTVVPLHPCLE